MITRHLPRSSFRRQRESYGKASRNTERAAVADDDRVEVSAVSPPRITGIVDVASPPTLSGLVILHSRDYVVVDGPNLLKIGLRARLLAC